jgi:predicted flap endonuclease-1-like 5' DNA nuclease
MPSKRTDPFDELTRLASDFVTAQRGMWDHGAWLGFLGRVQDRGIEISGEMQANLGDLLEAMREYHTAVSSTGDIEKAMNTVFNNSVAFIKRQEGVWGHAEWEDFVRTMQENTRTWSEGMEAYLGGVLESLKVFYGLFPALSVGEPQPAAASRPLPKPAPASERQPAGGPDDLTAIAGLGPAMARKLNQEGIVSYAQLAALTDAQIARLEHQVIKAAGRFKRDDWIGQAKRLSRA